MLTVMVVDDDPLLCTAMRRKIECRFVKHIGQQTRREKASGGVSLESCLSDGYG